jgi:hypothetical protein
MLTAIMVLLYRTWFIVLGLLKRKQRSTVERNVQVAHIKVTKPQLGLLLPCLPMRSRFI